MYKSWAESCRAYSIPTSKNVPSFFYIVKGLLVSRPVTPLKSTGTWGIYFYKTYCTTCTNCTTAVPVSTGRFRRFRPCHTSYYLYLYLYLQLQLYYRFIFFIMVTTLRHFTQEVRVLEIDSKGYCLNIGWFKEKPQIATTPPITVPVTNAACNSYILECHTYV